MKKKRLFWMLFPSYWLLTAIAILAVALYSFHSMSNLYFQTLEKDIFTRAALLSEYVDPHLLKNNRQEIDDLCKQLGESAQTRFTVIMPDGTVAGDSNGEPEEMENHSQRPEVRLALGGKKGMDTRYSRTMKREMMYISIPLRNDAGETVCAVRASLPMTAITGELNRMTVRVIAASLLAGLISMGVCIGVVGRITRPLHGMGRAAQRFSEGNFSTRIPHQQALELDQLAESLNRMSERLNNTLSTVIEQRNEQNTILSSMDEGVLAIDPQERIIHMNRVAENIFETNMATKREQLRKVVRYGNLIEFIKTVPHSRLPLERDMTLAGAAEKQIRVNGTVLRDTEGQAIGTLVVLRDVTQLRHLETVRSDFVANVSHELKTPITSIQGFVETLLSDDWEHSEKIRRFLKIIDQQAGRLNAILDDLLILSHLEQKGERVTMEYRRLIEILESALYPCRLQAVKKNIHINTVCPDNLMLHLNVPLFEQALVNLVINAVKYSDSGTNVLVLAERQGGRIAIHVKDEGFGITQKHLERLFERFYRVDTARSRKLGGTGLGLSIVKHIVQVHEGTIHVESKVGRGSIFTISLPAETKGINPVEKS